MRHDQIDFVAADEGCRAGCVLPERQLSAYQPA